LKGDKIQLPIQEDETALVLDALWKHYNKYKNKELIKGIYDTFIKNAGNFLVDFRDANNLPKESYDLWEEKLGVHTFTCATVYAGLLASYNFAKIFGENSDAEKYQKAAKEIQEAILKYLYDETDGVFIKGIFYDNDGKMVKDKTIDASTFYGLFEYKVIEADDPRLKRTFDKTFQRLWCVHPCGGLCRREDDHYYRVDKNAPENPWFISTMWLAEYYIANAKTLKDLKDAEDLLNWVVKRALKSGALAEQLNPLTGDSLSVSPLTWSHAGFIIAVIKYLEKFEELKKSSK